MFWDELVFDSYESHEDVSSVESQKPILGKKRLSSIRETTTIHNFAV